MLKKLKKIFARFSKRKATTPAPAPAPKKTLAQRIQETHAFLDPKNLADILIKYEGDVGLLIIDVQKEYCDPKHWRKWGSKETDSVSERIKALAPAFRKAGIPVYAVYFDSPKDKVSDIDFYKFIPEPEDTLVAKNQRSAFAGGNIKEVLDRDHKKLLLTCGVYLDRCVRDTSTDGVKEGFDVVLLRDLTADYDWDTGHTNESLSAMKKEGIAILQSEHVLKALQIAKNSKRPPKNEPCPQSLRQ